MFSETRFSSEILAAVFTLKWFLSTMYFHVIFKITWKNKNEATFVTRLLQTLMWRWKKFAESGGILDF